ncbi:YdeI/OmpD-associated family protein [Photobacterium sp. MCCC 1A19761]|uniref:YdeI/OmpD-associated family protein n=1 Tax=Photobacterium sp. MCCC 1A19761 TaxID=3115000 RepID=UPI00307DADF9
MPGVNNKEAQSFTTPEDFYEWLKENHESCNELWLKIYKKGSCIPSITWNESVKVALCWGWIDGIKRALDHEAYLQRFTPRRSGSHWSKRNTEHVASLIEQNLMTEAGMKHVRAAQADGRWEAAYAPVSEMQIPDDFLGALEQNTEAKHFFETLNKTQRFAISYGLETAKKQKHANVG